MALSISFPSPLCDDRRLPSLPSLSVRLPCLGSVPMEWCPPPPPVLDVSLDAELRRRRPEAAREGLRPRSRLVDCCEEEGIVCFVFSLSRFSAAAAAAAAAPLPQPEETGAGSASSLWDARENKVFESESERGRKERGSAALSLFYFLSLGVIGKRPLSMESVCYSLLFEIDAAPAVAPLCE